MSLFKKLFGSGKSKEENQIDFSKFKELTKSDFSSLEELIEHHAGLSFEKQMLFADIVGLNAWQFDMNNGNITFGNLIFPVQVIGSLSFNNYSWMWGWANKKSGIPENLLKQSNQLKKIGQEKNIKEFEEGHFNVKEGFEHKIGMISCGLFDSKSYYCANYGQGTLVVTIDDNKIPSVDKNQVEKVLTNFPQLISGVDLNHKNTFLNYLIDRDFRICTTENKIEGLRDKKIIEAEFDELDRLKNLNGKL